VPAVNCTSAGKESTDISRIAGRWLLLNQEISDLEELIGPLVRSAAPRLLARPRAGPGAAATLLIAVLAALPR
jgi:hypothetical protein